MPDLLFKPCPADIRTHIFHGCIERRYTATLVAEADGVLSGILHAHGLMEPLGLIPRSAFSDGDSVRKGDNIVQIAGNPLQVTAAEEKLIGALSKSSGVATAASRARTAAGGHCEVVSGGWKKMPFEIKDLIRQAVRDAGVGVRIAPPPFVYLDKNYVRILGGVGPAVAAAHSLRGPIVVQIRGETGSLEDEAVAAVNAGAGIVMVDTGVHAELERVCQALRQAGLRSKARIAFAGKITIEQIAQLATLDLDILDIGYAILDAPCLPMRFDVLPAGKAV